MRRMPLATATAAALLLAGCGGDNPFTSRPASVPDHPGANTAVTSANARAAATEAFGALGGAMQRVMSDAAPPPAAAKTTAHASTVSNMRVDGKVSGYVAVERGNYSFDGSTHELDADIAFTDFSDNGEIFVGGPVSIHLRVTPPPEGSDPDDPLDGLELSYEVEGNLAFSGKYKGTIGLKLNVSVSDGGFSMTGNIDVEGEKVAL